MLHHRELQSLSSCLSFSKESAEYGGSWLHPMDANDDVHPDRQ
jgi:hypothetical protein